MRRWLLIPVVAVVVAGCGSGKASPSHTTAAKMTATQVTSALAASGLPISGVIVYDASTDPNHLLGRPGGYTGKTAFRDSRVPAPSEAGDLSGGGSVEVFSTSQAAKDRANYIGGFAKGDPSLFGEYDYVSGLVVLRVSSVLTPSQAAAYRTALTKVAH